MKLNINGKLIEVADEEITKAIDEKKEQIDVTADLVLRTKEEDTTFQENLKKETIKIGAEIGRKEVIKGLGIEKEGVHKSDETAIATLKDWAEVFASQKLEAAKIEPNKKVDELTKDLNTLKATIQEKETAYNGVLNEFNNYKKSNKINSDLSGAIPDNVILPKEDMMTIIGMKVKLDVDDNNRTIGIGADGQPLKNQTTLEPLPIKDVVNNFFSENPQYLKGSSGGAGGSDSLDKSGVQSIDQFIAEQTQLGIKPNSEQFNNVMQERIKAGTLKID